MHGACKLKVIKFYKKGTWEMETVGKMILVLILLIILIGVVIALKNKELSFLNKIKDILWYR